MSEVGDNTQPGERLRIAGLMTRQDIGRAAWRLFAVENPGDAWPEAATHDDWGVREEYEARVREVLSAVFSEDAARV